MINHEISDIIYQKQNQLLQWERIIYIIKSQVNFIKRFIKTWISNTLIWYNTIVSEDCKQKWEEKEY